MIWRVRAMNGYLRHLVLVCVVTALGACAAPQVRHHKDFITPRPPQRTEAAPRDGAIYHASTSMALFEDVKARRVGDLLTVILAEKTDAQKQASTSTDKNTGVSMSNPTLLGGALSFNSPGFMPKRDLTLETSLDSSSKFKGQGDSSQSNSLTGNVTVTVVDVLSNGNLVVRGEKAIGINQGEEYVRVSGVVRPVDVATDNTVISTKLADANISYSGSGFMADSNRMGWLTRFLNSKWWPF